MVGMGAENIWKGEVMEISVLGEVIYRDCEIIVFQPYNKDKPVIIPRDYVAIVEDVEGTLLFMSKGLATKKNLISREVK